MAKIKVKLFADLREFAGGARAVEMEIVPGDTIARVIDQLGIPQERVKIIFVNARSAERDQMLEDGENLSIFSAIGGG